MSGATTDHGKRGGSLTHEFSLPASSSALLLRR